MNISITSGRKTSAIRCLVYGPEGIGKSTFAAQWPDPVFIDTEGSTNQMDVRRLPVPGSLNDFLEIVDWVAMTKPCQTLVVDTADWLEKIFQEDMCAEAEKAGIEEWGYGKGYQYLTDRMSKALNALDDVIKAGINVLLVGHAQIKKIEDPSVDPYDHWELKLQRRTAPLFKEWVDMLLFAKYEVLTSSDRNGRVKARGGKRRVMYTTHTAIADAKNRFGLDDEIPLDFESIAHIFDAESSGMNGFNSLSEPAPEKLEELEDPEDESAAAIDELIGLCRLSKVSKGELEQYCWQTFESSQVRNVDSNQWPEEFIRMLTGSWQRVMDGLREADVLSLDRDDLPF